MCIIDLFLFVQGKRLPLEHIDNLDNPFVRDSNFKAILKGFANMDDTLENHFEDQPKNAKMCSAKIQKEIIVFNKCRRSD